MLHISGRHWSSDWEVKERLREIKTEKGVSFGAVQLLNFKIISQVIDV